MSPVRVTRKAPTAGHQAAIAAFTHPADDAPPTGDLSDEQTALCDRLDRLAELASMPVGGNDDVRLIRCCASRSLCGILADLAVEHQADLVRELAERGEQQGLAPE